ncbi:MAG: DinB family protein [Fulvivirga sp.]
MQYNQSQAIHILERTPAVLKTFLYGLSIEWTSSNEGPDTWSPFDIIGHLIHGEQEDWLKRTNLILSDNEDKTFEPFDRFAQFELSKGKTINELLDEFEALRIENLRQLKELNLSEEQLQLKGRHPALGDVTLKELFSCWVVHDLGHISQISRVMAKQYKAEVGPWIEFLGILK